VALLGFVVASEIDPSSERLAAQASTVATYAAVSEADPAQLSVWLSEAHSIAARQGEDSPAADTF